MTLFCKNVSTLFHYLSFKSSNLFSLLLYPAVADKNVHSMDIKNDIFHHIGESNLLTNIFYIYLLSLMILSNIIFGNLLNITFLIIMLLFLLQLISNSNLF